MSDRPLRDPRDDVSDEPAPAVAAPIDPVAMARRDLTKTLPRRFYEVVSVVGGDGGFGPALDDRPVRTPAKAPLVLPTQALAEAIAAEWAAQGEIVQPDSMPLTRLANSAIDGVTRSIDATATEIARFAESDLVCYRADGPETLTTAQAEAWDPILTFARDNLGAGLICTRSVMPIAQPPEAIAAVRAAVAQVAAGGRAGPLRLAALSVMTTLTGSVLIALAVARGAIDVEAAWGAATVDEEFQMRHWGSDAEALTRATRRRDEFEAAARLYTLAG